MSGSRIPFARHSDTDEYERTTAGRKPCPSCGEWAYPRRKAGSHGGFAFAPECAVCGQTFPDALTPATAPQPWHQDPDRPVGLQVREQPDASHQERPVGESGQ